MMKMIKRLLIIFLLLLVPVGLWLGFSGNDETDLYRTAEITRGDIAEVVTANGTLNPIQIVNVGAQVSGKVEKLYVEVNDEVKKGQLLAEIDPALLKADLKQTKANLETQRTALTLSARDLARTRELVKKDYVAKVELERAEQSYQAAKNAYDVSLSQLEQAELNLDYTNITSPIDGVIISQEITLGQTLASNFQSPNLFKIAGDLTQMKIDVNFAEADISKVKAGLPVSFTVDAFPDGEFEGVVQTVNLNPNNQSGVVTYSVTVEVENKDKLLLPGMTAFVSVILSEKKDVLRVPAAALRFTPPEKQVSGLTRLFQGGGMRRPPRSDIANAMQRIHVLKNGTLTPVEVTVGSTDETFVEISGAGIKEGDIVATGLMPKKK